MGRSAAIVVVVFFATACSSAELESRSSAPEQGMEIHASVAPVAGMDGRASSEEGASSRPPGWVDGSGGLGPSGPPAAIVPDVRGMGFARAVHRLWRTGIGFGLVFARASDGVPWSVIEQNPPPGSDTPNSGEIDLVLSMRVAGNAAAVEAVRCNPTAANLSDPYCIGKLLKY